MVIKQIIYMVLSLIVLVTIIGVPLYDYANTQIFGGKGIKKWITGEKQPFAPYKGELDLEQQKVHDSLSALVCATNVVASSKDGKFVYDEKNCPEAVASKDAECQGVLYGESCVVCEKRDSFVDCQVKNFELPQKLSDDEDESLSETAWRVAGKINPFNWISAKGDPEYVIYYEAFPLGEEESWQLDPKEVSLATIAAWDILIPAGGFAGKKAVQGIKRGADFLSNSRLGKVASFGSKWSGAAFAYKMAAATGRVLVKRPLEWTVKKISMILKSGIEYTKDAAGKVTLKIISPEMYIKIFSDAESVLKYAKPEDIKNMFGGKVDDLLNAVRKGEEKTFIDVFEATFQEDVKLSLAKTSFIENLKDVPANIKPLLQKSAFNAVVLSTAIASAREDSMDDKFAPIGVNAIGFKKPYNEALVTGEVLPVLNEEVNNYYLALNKEGEIQKRFFLASPCKTNLKIKTWKCRCAKTDEVDEIMDGRFLANKLSFTENNYKFAVKECAPLELGVGEKIFTNDLDGLIESKSKNINCISIEPQDVEGFCYSGSHWLASTAAWTFYGTSFATGIFAQATKVALVGGGTAVGGPPGFFVGLGISVGVGAIQTGFDYSLALLESWATSYTKWPYH